MRPNLSVLPMQAAADGLQAKAETLEAWGPLHAVRVAAGTASAGIMIYALAQTK